VILCENLLESCASARTTPREAKAVYPTLMKLSDPAKVAYLMKRIGSEWFPSGGRL